MRAARLPSYHPLQGRPGKGKLKKRASPAASTVAAAPCSTQHGYCGCAAVMWWGLAERYILYSACSARLLPVMRGAGGEDASADTRRLCGDRRVDALYFTKLMVVISGILNILRYKAA